MDKSSAKALANICIVADATLLLRLRVSIEVAITTNMVIAAQMEVFMNAIVNIGLVMFTALGT
jgi:hypothetical protein